MELVEEKGRADVAEMECGSLQQKIVSLEDECEERNKMAKEWYDSLQVSQYGCLYHTLKVWDGSLFRCC